MVDRRATCLNCMDGRIQLPVIHWIRENFPVDFIDIITEAGMDRVLSDSKEDIKLITRSINVSLKLNKSRVIFVVGHYDCRGNPAAKATHLKQIKQSVQRLQKIWPKEKIVGLWVNNRWRVELIHETKTKSIS